MNWPELAPVVVSVASSEQGVLLAWPLDVVLADTGVVVIEAKVPMLVSEVVRESEVEEGVDSTLLVGAVVIGIEEGEDDEGNEVSVSVIVSAELVGVTVPEITIEMIDEEVEVSEAREIEKGDGVETRLLDDPVLEVGMEAGDDVRAELCVSTVLSELVLPTKIENDVETNPLVVAVEAIGREERGDDETSIEVSVIAIERTDVLNSWLFVLNSELESVLRICLLVSVID